MPGSPQSDVLNPKPNEPRAVHPAALLLALFVLGAGLTMTRSWIDLAAASALLGVAALRVEGRPLRGEVALLGLALVVFAAHVLFAGRAWRSALSPAALIAFRLLALLYLLRWAARAFLGRSARWLMGRTPPSRPHWALLLFESGRLAAALLPLALREGEQHALALRARGLRPGRGARGRARHLLAWFLPFLGTMLRLSDAYADALLARGYVLGARRRSGLRVRWGAAEVAVIVGSAGLTAWLLRGA